jgi:hypothetical protein
MGTPFTVMVRLRIDPGRQRLSSLKETTIEEENNMKLEMIGAATLSRVIESKHVAALPHYQTRHRDTSHSLDNGGSAAR